MTALGVDRAVPEPPATTMIDLNGADRERAVPILIASFEGIYRWHAKRTLRDISRVRAVVRGGTLAGISMLERLAPEVGYVYYLAVDPAFRGQGVGGVLLDDALRSFREAGASVVYGAAEEENQPSRRLFLSRGFREVAKHETGYREGGLGAWGLRSRMRIVYGELLYGLRFPADPAPS
jgi:ribosomal protein S18 acetylase RimI-like enzyme